MSFTSIVRRQPDQDYSQLKELELHLKDVNHPSIVALKGLLQEFRDDELEHLDTGRSAHSIATSAC